MAKVSVIIPTHNRANLLPRAVTSVLRQTFQDFEIVIVDDASDDATQSVVMSFGEPRIKYVRHNENLGVGCARNTAVYHSSGDYIAFIDDDDEWLPEKLQRQVERMETLKSDVGVTFTGYWEVENSTNRVLSENTGPKIRATFDEMLSTGFLTPTSTLMVRAECFERVGLFDPTLRYGEDLDMWLRLAQEYEFDCIEQCLVKLYAQASRLTQNPQAIIAGWERLLSKYQDFFEQNRDAYSRRLQAQGTFHCLAGDVRKGRELFRTAVAYDPFAFKAYLSLGLSLTGATTFKRFYTLRNRLA